MILRTKKYRLMAVVRLCLSGFQARPLLSQRRFQNSQPYGRRQAGICKPGRAWQDMSAGPTTSTN
ncbi:hypothetical protein BGLA2_1080068 [Burkholderia gladioli]|nr:hypothetical protein BGLA2_1080068 [Burkholderia gladioli]